jgi:hypothetical protein
MDKHLSIVRVDTRPHRVIAQENWGLTKEQMSGMHVHHRIHRAKGGTDDPTNLYVCSVWYHKNAWHSEERVGTLIEYAQIGGKKAAELGPKQGTGFYSLTKKEVVEYGRRGGVSNKKNSTGLFSRTPEEWSVQNRINGEKGWEKAGRSTYEQKKGIWGMTEEEKKERNQKGASVLNTSYVMCLETGHLSTPGGMGMYQRARGIDKSRRVKMKPEELAFIFAWG